MKEIGGYIELDTYTGAMLHEKSYCPELRKRSAGISLRSEDDSEVISAVFSLRFCAKSLQKK